MGAVTKYCPQRQHKPGVPAVKSVGCAGKGTEIDPTVEGNEKTYRIYFALGHTDPIKIVFFGVFDMFLQHNLTSKSSCIFV